MFTSITTKFTKTLGYLRRGSRRARPTWRPPAGYSSRPAARSRAAPSRSRAATNELDGGPKDFVLTTSGFTNLPGNKGKTKGKTKGENKGKNKGENKGLKKADALLYIVILAR